MKNQTANTSASKFQQAKSKICVDLLVIEPLRVKQQVIKSATEATNMILKIDDYNQHQRRRKNAPNASRTEWAGGMGGMSGMGGRNALLKSQTFFTLF